jgi:hypothetical protein
MCLVPGTVSASSSKRFPLSSTLLANTPVIFPPGCARLATKPSFTGSPRSHHNGNRAGRFRGGTECWATYPDDDVDLKTDQLSRQIGKSIGFGPARPDFEDIVFSLDVTQLS